MREVKLIDAVKLIDRIEACGEGGREIAEKVRPVVEALLLEKSTPKPPKEMTDIYPRQQYKCPECGASVTSQELYMNNRAFGDLYRTVRLRNCINCGQAIGWEGE